MNVGIDNVTVDQGLSARDIVNLGKQFKSLTPDTLAQFQIPVVNARWNGASVVKVDITPAGSKWLAGYEARQVAHPVPVGVREAAWVDLVDDGTAPPGRAGAGAGAGAWPGPVVGSWAAGGGGTVVGHRSPRLGWSGPWPWTGPVSQPGLREWSAVLRILRGFRLSGAAA